MSKKILFIGNSASIHTKKWVDYFNEKYEVHLITFAKENITSAKNIYFVSKKTSQVKGGNYHYMFSIYSISKIIKKIKPDYINAHYSYSMGLLGLLAKKLAKVNSVYSVVCHGSDILNTPKPKSLYSFINRYVLKNSDKIFVVSDQIFDEINNWGIDEKKIFIGQYGINLEIFKLNTEIKDIDIFSNRSYFPNSRWDLILDSVKNLRNKKIVFIMPEIKEEELIKLKKTYPHIIFFKKLNHEENISFLKRSKIYISATRSDGTSLSLLEAMACGAIPLVSNIPSNRSWIVDGINGFLFRNKKELEDKLRYIFNLNEDKLQSIRKINFQLIEEKANYKTQMKKIEEFLIK